MANNEEVPKKIKWKGNIYEYDGETQNYIRLINCTYDWLLGEDIIAMLNDEIEIIEEKPISSKPFKYYLEDTSDLPQIDKDNRIIEYIHQMSLKINYLLEKESDK